MDVSGSNAANASTAVVARQFVPSRIEWQLLTRAFELIYAPRGGVEESREPSADDVRIVEAGKNSRGEGRRAA